MDAIVSLLDDAHTRRIELVWDELRSRFGLISKFATRYSHFSFLSAENIDADVVDSALAPIAESMHGLTVRTAGLGLFPGKTSVIFLPIVRSAELTNLHQKIWESVGSAVGAAEPFAPDNWIPHITLTLDGLGDADPMPVLAWLAGLDLAWTIDIDNLAVITSDGECRKFLFGSVPRRMDMEVG